MKKIYKYLVAWIGITQHGELQTGNTFVECGEPLDTQKAIEKVKKDIMILENVKSCSIIYMKRVKVDRLESGS